MSATPNDPNDPHERDDRDPSRSSRLSAKGLTSRIAKGDSEAFTLLYEKWFDRMVGMAIASTDCDEAFAADAAQDAFVKLIRNPVVLENDRALTSYLRKLVITSAYDRLKSEKRRAVRENDRPAPAGGTPDRTRLGEVEEAISLMETEQADLLIARFRFGWTLARIGERFNLATGAVDGRIGRLVRYLRHSLGNEDES